jgi:hypothetical protein
VATELALKRQFAALAKSGLPVGAADFSDAHPAPIVGSDSSAWIAPSGGKVCTYLPDPVDGWGGGCYPLGSVEEGRAYTILGGGVTTSLAGSVIVAVVVPDGDPAPSVLAPDGSSRTLAVTGNIAAAIVPSADTLETGGLSINLDDTVKPAKVRWVG